MPRGGPARNRSAPCRQWRSRSGRRPEPSGANGGRRRDGAGWASTSWTERGWAMEDLEGAMAEDGDGVPNPWREPGEAPAPVRLAVPPHRQVAVTSVHRRRGKGAARTCVLATGPPKRIGPVAPGVGQRLHAYAPACAATPGAPRRRRRRLLLGTERWARAVSWALVSDVRGAARAHPEQRRRGRRAPSWLRTPLGRGPKLDVHQQPIRDCALRRRRLRGRPPLRCSDPCSGRCHPRLRFLGALLAGALARAARLPAAAQERRVHIAGP